MYTSRLLISKHQQVQLLEAASVLIGMNQDVVPDAKNTNSDDSSASPEGSATSDIRDDEYISSAESTPPPIHEHYAVVEGIDTGRGKRYSGNRSSFSRSYQSAPSISFPNGNAFRQYHQLRRPSTSGFAFAKVDDEQAGLVAAVESLCSFGTPRTGSVFLPSDVLPMPPLLAQYVEQNANRLSGNLGSAPQFCLRNSAYQRLTDERQVKMGGRHVVYVHEDYDYDDRLISHGRNDDDDDGGF